jgi:putative FmdB family regulatory protein
MRLFEYECEDCKKIFETWISDKDIKKLQICPNCGSKHTKKTIPNVGIDFSKGGTGFYKNDYQK